MIQTRNDNGELKQFSTFASALEEARLDKGIWKISFDLPQTGDRIRLIKTESGWTYEDINGDRGI